MNPRRDMRNNRVALFDGIEEGGIRATSSYSHEIDEHDNERAMEGLQDRVNLLKRATYMRRWIATIACLIGWEMIWIHQEEYSQEPWTSLRWYSRPNQAGECLHLWHLLWLFSLLYTILLGN
uniref:Uncharacterized protein n=1 Tax=Gossypium raimondii TaxID=29730 RepID=A0A0D2QSL9_GOSRA|nr:hypothetical protein B456_007G144100 [Gossypium raimondii]